MKKVHEREQLPAIVPPPQQWNSFVYALRTFSTDKATNRQMSPEYMAEQIRAGFDPLRYNVSNGSLLHFILSSKPSPVYFDALFPLLNLSDVLLDENDATGILKKSFEEAQYKYAERLVEAGLAGYRAGTLTEAKNQDQFLAGLTNLKATGVVKHMDHLMSSLLRQDKKERTAAFLAHDLPVEGSQPGSNATENILSNLLHTHNDLETIRIVAERYRLADHIRQHDGLKTKSPLSMVRQRSDYREAMDFMLSLGLHIDGRDAADRTGLMNEVAGERTEDLEMVRYWIERGADIDAQDKDGKSVLALAVAAKRIRTVDLLHEYGVDLMARNKKRNLAFVGHYNAAAEYCHHLLGRSLPSGINMAMVAACGNWPEKLGEAFQNGDDPTHVSDQGQTILEAVIRLERAVAVDPRIFQIMEEAGADMNARIPMTIEKTKEEVLRHPLHWLIDKCESSVQWRQKLVSYLALTKTVDVNVLDNDGQTPLYRAARDGDHDVFKALIDAGADTGIRCGRLTLKAVAKDEKIKEMLLSATTGRAVAEGMASEDQVSPRAAATSKERGVSPL